ncbi:MAG: oxidoreductase [Bdellovibrionaceae bacterium]|nr:hypothetical protein [Bdellovibrionales bacterium]MCB9084016.1 oxidoreductase [Pseudobdellovibrionaceae bacterium]
MKRSKKKLRLGVWKLTSCDGCQLSLLDCEDELLAITQAVEVAYFMEATSHAQPGPYDLSLVEGSISTPEQLEQIKDIRKESGLLVAIGACATSGGIQALRNYADIEAYKSLVYASPEHIETLSTSTAISQHVSVDFELQGCPISKEQLIEVLVSLLHGKKPTIPNYAVCVECKLRGTVCLPVSQGRACLGPITQAGCQALCPSYNRGCFGCYGPKELSQPSALTEFVRQHRQADDREWLHLLRNYQTGAPEFHEEGQRHEEENLKKN